MTHQLNIAYFYPELLNLYGDHGNVMVLVQRCRWRGVDAKVTEYSINSSLPGVSSSEYPDLVFMGGGPDSAQTQVALDLKVKTAWFKAYAISGGVGLYICGAYQLLGRYYQDALGNRLEGVGVFDLYTRHFGKNKPRCIGNLIAETDLIPPPGSVQDPNPPFFTRSGLARLIGFENHGGRTYLGPECQSLGRVTQGGGNNGEDGGEGAVYKNSFGTYLHGPLLPKNPHLADHLIWRALTQKYPAQNIFLQALDDHLEWQAHESALSLK